jgi:8-oxo-dGTP diphosphatase
VSYTDRVLAYVTRERDGRRELLVFDHRDYPDAGTQVPAGRLEPDEDREAGLLRELEEEAGLADARIVRKFAKFGPGELPHGRSYTNHAYELESPGARDEWEHTVVGDGDDRGLVFRYRWVPLEPEPTLWGGVDPVLSALVDRSDAGRRRRRRE